MRNTRLTASACLSRRTAVLVGTAVVLAPLAWAAPASASPTGNEIAYVRFAGATETDSGGGGDSNVVVLLDLETRRSTTLQPPAGATFLSAVLTPDGRNIVVSYERVSDRSSGLAVLARNGSGLRPLTSHVPTTTMSVLDLAPTVSPDGATVLFTRLSDKGPQSNDTTSRLYSVPFAGGAAKLVSTPRDAFGASFSPDGKQIVTELEPQDSKALDGPIVRLNLDGSGAPLQLAPLGSAPAWSPDGTTIAFSLPKTPPAEGELVQQIATVRADGVGGVKVLAASRPLSRDSYANDPTWLPDSRSIVFSLLDVSRDDNSSIWAMDAAGTRAGRVSTGRDDRISPAVQGPALGNVSAGSPSAFSAITPTRLLDTRAGLGAPQAKVGPGSSIDLQVIGAGTPLPAVAGTATATATIPATATAVVLNVTVTNPTSATDVRVYPTGSGVPLASNLNTSAGRTVPNLVTVPLGAGGKVSLFNSGGSVDLLADVAGYYTTPGAGEPFTSLTPGRILDTRRALGAPSGKVQGAGTVDLKVTGALPTADGGTVSVPADASAVVLNVTGADVTGSTDVRVYPTPIDGSVPTVSTLNLRAGQTAANLVTVRVGRDGTVRLRNNEASLDLIADIAGYYSPGSTSLFVPVTPLRFLDTRTGTGAAPISVGAGIVVDLPIGGSRGVPAGATAAVLNITGTGVSASTDVRAYPAGASAVPTVSNLNLVRGSTRANLAVVRVGSSGSVLIRNNAGTTQLIGDLAGYMVPRS